MTGLYSINTRAVGTVLTAAIYNTDHQNHVDNFIPTMMDDYSLNVSQMRSQVDPGENGTEILSTTIAGELERLRFSIAELKGSTYWYETAANFLPGYIFGLTLSNNAVDIPNDLDIAAGACADNTNKNLIILGSALTKQLDAVWAVGTNAGMRASGAAIANTTYHIFAIRRPDTGVVDIAADTSVTGANIAANTNVAYTQKRRIASITREGGNIVGFVQDGDTFIRTFGTVFDVNATNPGTAAVTRTLTVPLGLNVTAIFNALLLAGASTTYGLLTDMAAVDDNPATSNRNLGAASGGQMASQFQIRTNTSGQIRSRLSFSDGATALQINTIGWRDRRGRDV